MLTKQNSKVTHEFSNSFSDEFLTQMPDSRIPRSRGVCFIISSIIIPYTKLCDFYNTNISCSHLHG